MTNGTAPVSNTNRHSNKHATSNNNNNKENLKNNDTMISPGRWLPAALVKKDCMIALRCAMVHNLLITAMQFFA